MIGTSSAGRRGCRCRGVRNIRPGPESCRGGGGRPCQLTVSVSAAVVDQGRSQVDHQAVALVGEGQVRSAQGHAVAGQFVHQVQANRVADLRSRAVRPMATVPVMIAADRDRGGCPGHSSGRRSRGRPLGGGGMSTCRRASGTGRRHLAGAGFEARAAALDRCAGQQADGQQDTTRRTNGPACIPGHDRISSRCRSRLRCPRRSRDRSRVVRRGRGSGSARISRALSSVLFRTSSLTPAADPGGGACRRSCPFPGPRSTPRASSRPRAISASISLV